MKDLNTLKKKLIDYNITFRDLVKYDGRSYQHLHQQSSEGNEKILNKMFEIAEVLKNKVAN